MRGGAGGDEGGGDGVSTNLPIAPRDASDGRVSGLVSDGNGYSIISFIALHGKSLIAND